MNIQALQNSNDFVSVQLTPEGLAAAEGGPMVIHGAGVELSFTGSAPQQVHRTVWAQTLKTVSPFGKPWFELTPAAPAAAPVAKPTAIPAPAANETTAK